CKDCRNGLRKCTRFPAKVPMKLTEALQIIQRVPANARPYHVLLVCGFTPIHLQHFLTACLQLSLPEYKPFVRTGLYGDLLGTLRSAAAEDLDAVAIVLERPDLDPRLGYRSLGGW